MRRLRVIPTFLTVAWLACATGAQIVIPPGVLEKTPPKKIPPQTPDTRPAGEKVDLQRLIINFRQAAGNAEKRKAAADKLLEQGPRGAKILRAIISSDLPRRTAAYKKAFYNKARGIGAAKFRATGDKRIQKWRQQFNSMGAVNKETLKAKGGPAMDGLLEALVPKRREVLEGGKSLTARREEIIALDSILGQCGDLLESKSTGDGLSKTLEQQEKLISLMCAPMGESRRKSIESDMKKFDRMSFEEWHGFVHLNVVRILLGLRPMRIDLRLSAAARDHSKDMDRLKFFSHESPVKGKSTPGQRASRQGTSCTGECIAGSKSGPGAIRMWFFSPGHHKIIMSNASRVGLGGHGGKWTLMVG